MRRKNRRKRHFVTIQTPPTTKGTRGQLSGSWTTSLASYPATVITLSGAELEKARTNFQEAQLEVELYKPTGVTITKKHRLQFEGRTLEVGFVDDLENRGVELKLLCSELT